VTHQRLEYHRLIRTHLRSAYLLPEEKIDTLLPRFLESLQALLHNLEQALETGPQENQTRSCHALKGALLNLGLRELAAIASTLEQNCRNPDPQFNSARITNELKEEIQKII